MGLLYMPDQARDAGPTSWSKFHSNHSSMLFTPPDFPICQLTSKYTVQPSNPFKTAPSKMESALGQGVSRVSKQCANHFNDNQVILFY